MYAKRSKINLCYVALSKTHTQGHLSKTLQRVYFASLLLLLLLCLALIVERDTDKLRAQNKRILRFILDYSSPYRTLLTKVNSTPMCNKRVHNFLIFLYKSLFFTHFPAYMK